MRFLLRAALALPLLSLAQAPLAQAPLAQATTVLEHFGLDRGRVQDVQPRRVGGGVEVEVVLGDETRVLRLEPSSLLAPGFRLIVDDGTVVRSVAPRPSRTLRGTVLGAPASDVFATLEAGRITAFVRVGGGAWAIEPVPIGLGGSRATTHVAYAAPDVTPSHVTCGFSGGPAAASTGSIGTDGGGPTGVARECEIALDCDNAFFTRNGSDLAATQSAATMLVGAMDAIYQRDVGICYTITAIVVRTSPVYTSGLNLGCGGSGLIQEMRSIWRANHLGIARDTAHLLSGLGSFSGTIGCAYGSVVCGSAANGSGYGVSRVVSSNLLSNARLLSHELGHNWSAGHCDSSSPCRIMCSNLSGCSGGAQFSPTAIAQIVQFRDTRSCLSDCSSCAVQASYVVDGVDCAGGRPSSPSLGFAGAPQIGGTFDVSVASASANTTVALIWGARAVNVDLSPLGAVGCQLYVGAVFGTQTRTTDLFGRATWTLNVPASAGLCGLVTYQQIAVVDPMANALQVLTSRRGVVTFGS